MPTNSTAAVPSAVSNATNSPKRRSINTSFSRAPIPSLDFRAKRSSSRSSCPKAFTTRVAPRTSWITDRAELSSFFTSRDWWRRRLR